jgi:hypothetical protein
LAAYPESGVGGLFAFGGLRVLLSNSTSHRLTKQGTGSPEGVVTALVGTIYVQSDGDQGAVLWAKKTGTGNTGWELQGSATSIAGITGPTVAKTSAYTASLDDFAILGDATSAAFSVTLPTAASAEGHLYFIKKVDSSANAVTVDGDTAEEIDGDTTLALGDQYEGVLILSDGTDWHILAHPQGDGGVTLADGDYGDVTVSGTGTIITIDDDTVTYAKIQDVSATDKVLGRSTAGSGDVEEIACTAAGRALLDDADAAAQRATLGFTAVATEAGATYTYVLTDAFKYYRFTDGSPQVTVPANGSVAFPVGTELHGIGTTGQVELIEDSGVTINTPETLFTAKAFAAFTLKKVATDEWDLMGYLEAA